MATYLVQQSATFEKWLKARMSADRATYRRILAHVLRIGEGNFGDAKSVGDRVSELRLGFGPGYRIYFTIIGLEVVVLLAGGDKSIQQKDNARAREIVKQLPWW